MGRAMQACLVVGTLMAAVAGPSSGQSDYGYWLGYSHTEVPLSVSPAQPTIGDEVFFTHPYDGLIHPDSCGTGQLPITIYETFRQITVELEPWPPGTVCLDVLTSGIGGDLGRLPAGSWKLWPPLAIGGPLEFEVLPLLPGDANRDGFVDVSDFNIWNQNKFLFDRTWDTGDFTGNGVTDVEDFNIWNQHKFQSMTSIIPEPSTAILICLGFAFVTCRWYRKPQACARGR